MISNSTSVGINNSVNNNTKNNRSNKPSFKGGLGLMNFPGWAMNKIEDGGFVASFLIQDTAGMTCPRSREGLYRDRDKKHTKFKDLNFKEAAEVFIREFLSGPLMMFTPFVVFALSKKFIGKSTFSNTGLLKKMGKILTGTVKEKQAGQTSSHLKENFYRSTIGEMLDGVKSGAAGKDKVVDRIYGHVTKLDELESQLGKAKGKSFIDKIANIFKPKDSKIQSEKDIIKEQIEQAKDSIKQELNSFHKSNSTEMNLVNRVKLDGEAYDSAKAIEAMRAYASDASRNNMLETFTEKDADKFAKASMMKRIAATVGAAMATIGSTSIVPSLYAILNPVPPGALDTNCANPNHKHENATPQNNTTPTEKSSNVSFKGNPLRLLQFDGNQFTPLLMTTIAGGGLILPRVRTAIKRAPQDENGKKNLIEIPEILTRDVISTLAVTFGVPMLTKAMVNLYKKASGFVLMDKYKEGTSKFKKFLDMINPLSSIEPYSNADTKEIYGNITNKEQLKNFTEFVDNNDGHLVKVLKKLKNGKECFAGTEADFDLIANLDKKGANAKIKKVVTELFDDKMVEKLMMPAEGSKLNGMYRHARNLNSLPRFINTLVLVPAFLGVVLPKIVYGITAKNRRKMGINAEMQNTPFMPISIKKKFWQDTAFRQIKHDVDVA